MIKKKNRRNTDIFSLAFLDIIACGFGAIVLLLLIVKPDLPGVKVFSESELMQNLFSLQDKKLPLEDELQYSGQEITELQNILNSKNEEELKLIQEIESIRSLNSMIKGVKNDLNLAQQSLTEEMKRILENNDRDVEVGGIPVDSEYIVFIIDNSDSMISAWPYLIKEMNNVLEIHPQIKGIQVMNDQGKYLLPRTSGKGKWILDTTGSRKNIMDFIKRRANLGQSRSNPINGLRVAINNHFIEGRKVSIYLLGDDIRGDIDLNLRKIETLNTDRISGEKKVRIHGIVFASSAHANLIGYSQFVRQLTLNNEGSALWIPIPGHPGWYDCSGANCGHVAD